MTNDKTTHIDTMAMHGTMGRTNTMDAIAEYRLERAHARMAGLNADAATARLLGPSARPTMRARLGATLVTLGRALVRGDEAAAPRIGEPARFPGSALASDVARTDLRPAA